MGGSEERLFVSVVIPVFNSQETIGPLVEKIMAELGVRYSLEIVLINDCSRDRSEGVCLELFRRFPGNVKFYSLAKNVGEHNAVMAGLNHARGDYVVIMDDDFQNPSDEVPTLVEAAREGRYDAVYSRYDHKRHSWFRNLGSWFNDKVANVMLSKPRDLYLSSFKVLNRFTVDEIKQYKLPYPYVDGLILRTTSKIGQVQVAHAERKSGRSGYSLTKLVFLWSNMFTNFSIFPLRVAIFLGILFSVLGFFIGIYTVIEKILDPKLPIGWAGLAVSIAIFGGIQLLALGMIGEYVGRIFLSLNKKPQYVIRKAFEPAGTSD